MKCSDCSTEDEQLHYKSGKMKRCYDCQNFDNLTKKKTGGGVAFTREDFLLWKATQGRRCTYCGITRDDLYAMNILNPRNKRRYESIGVDRLDNALNYTLDNIVSCCGPCNGIKSGILTHDEMLSLGLHLRFVWNQRLVGQLNK